MVLMEGGASLRVCCLGAMETPLRVSVRSSMLTSSFSLLGDDDEEADGLSSSSPLVSELLSTALDSLFSSASEEPTLTGVSIWLSLLLTACGVDAPSSDVCEELPLDVSTWPLLSLTTAACGVDCDPIAFFKTNNQLPVTWNVL